MWKLYCLLDGPGIAVDFRAQYTEWQSVQELFHSRVEWWEEVKKRIKDEEVVRDTAGMMVVVKAFNGDLFSKKPVLEERVGEVLAFLTNTVEEGGFLNIGLTDLTAPGVL